MSQPIPPTEATEAPTQHQCGRCRSWFDTEAGVEPLGIGDWWVCEPCAALLLPGRTVRA